MDLNMLLDKPQNLLVIAICGAGFLILLSYAFNIIFFKPSKYRLKPLPGPKPKFLVGNLFDLPPPNMEQAYHYWEMSKKYGPIMSLSVLGRNLVFIHKLEIANELLDKRQSMYSNRPKFVFAELAGMGMGMTLAQPDDEFRQMRKFSHSQIGSTAVLSKWSKMIDVETRRFLLRILERPDKFIEHATAEVRSIILKIMYGYQTEPDGNDRLIDQIEHSMDNFGEAVKPGKWLVDALPVLKYIPEWMPGGGFKRVARDFLQYNNEIIDIPYGFTKRQLEAKTATRSMVADILIAGDANKPLTPRQEKLLKGTALELYAGGSHTSAHVMEVFFLAMTKYPHVLQKAQAEIDRVIGATRLPNSEDKAQLPYCEAVVKEVIRWEPVAGVLMAHVSTEDDEYDGYFIPKGSLLMTNLIALAGDPEMYSDPGEFKPERFLGDNPERDLDATFGFGKRVCPGRLLAQYNLFLETVRIVACFDIKPVKGDEPKREFTIDFLRNPKPFKADIKPRSAAWVRLIREVEITDPWPKEGDSKLL